MKPEDKNQPGGIAAGRGGTDELLDRLTEAVAAQQQSAARVQADLRTLTFTGTSEDRQVSVTVDLSGALLDLDLEGVGSFEPQSVRRAVLQARDEAAGRAQEIRAERLRELYTGADDLLQLSAQAPAENLGAAQIMATMRAAVAENRRLVAGAREPGRAAAAAEGILDRRGAL